MEWDEVGGEGGDEELEMEIGKWRYGEGDIFDFF